MVHVVAEWAGVSFVPQPEQQIFFDDTGDCLHLVEGRMINSVPMQTALISGSSGGSRRGVAAAAQPRAGFGDGGSAGALAPHSDPQQVPPLCLHEGRSPTEAEGRGEGGGSEADEHDDDATSMQSVDSGGSVSSRGFLVSQVGWPSAILCQAPSVLK